MLMRLLIAFLALLPVLGADYDWLFRNARIVDGTGNPWFHGDVAVTGGKIAGVGDLANDDAERIVDARERVLAPGFIDIHTHVEGAIEKVPLADNFLLDGVTTAVTGNCGNSSINLAEWFEELEEMGLGLNLASFVGHNSVRREAMGVENRQATPEELRQMRELVEQAMRDGAVGLSTGLMYVPGTYAGTEEVVALAKAAGRHGGIYASHIRYAGNRVFEAIEEAILIGAEADVPVQISHLKISSKDLWGSAGKVIALIATARSEGVDVAADQYPYARASTGLNILLPSWALAGGQQKLKQRFLDAAVRERISQGMKETLKQWGQQDYSFATVASFTPQPGLEGRTVTEINQLRERPKTLANEILTVMEMVNQGGAGMIYHVMSLEDVETILRYPNTAVASDGGPRVFGKGKPHPRSYGTNARVLAEFVRERKALTLEDAIRRMTSLPARRLGFRDRGLLVEGLAADLVLFDPGIVQDKATFEQPHQFSEGFDIVLVNGEAVVEDGKITGARPGRILRHRAAGPPTQ